MKSKLEKFGKFEVSNRSSIRGGQQFACNFDGGFQFIIEEEDVPSAESWGAECVPYFQDTISN